MVRFAWIHSKLLQSRWIHTLKFHQLVAIFQITKLYVNQQIDSVVMLLYFYKRFKQNLSFKFSLSFSYIAKFLLFMSLNSTTTRFVLHFTCIYLSAVLYAFFLIISCILFIYLYIFVIKQVHVFIWSRFYSCHLFLCNSCSFGLITMFYNLTILTP